MSTTWGSFTWGASLWGMVTDRTQADFTEWETLSKIPWANMTEAQRARWSVPLKGAYNYTDLNRVGIAMLELKSILVSYGYAVSVNVRADYTVGEWPTKALMNAYIQSLKNIRSAVEVASSTPQAPDSMDNGTVTIWNNIEQILLDVEDAVAYLAKYSNQYISGIFYAGDNRRVQRFSRGRKE